MINVNTALMFHKDTEAYSCHFGALNKYVKDGMFLLGSTKIFIVSQS